MEQRIKRSERVVAITRLLSENPGKLFTLSEIGERFQCAKSTLSEDITLVRQVLSRYGMGRVETYNGAAGGVRFFSINSGDADLAFVQLMCQRLAQPERILPGGFLYNTDLFSRPDTVGRMGEIFARRFYAAEPDVVVTVESMGVPIALMTARALGKPLVTARRGNRATEGSTVTINYLSGSSQRMQTMSLSRRLLAEGQRALLIDDFMKGGGTARALWDMMAEFNVTVVGTGVILATAEPVKKRVDDYVSLIQLERVDEAARQILLHPADWVQTI